MLYVKDNDWWESGSSWQRVDLSLWSNALVVFVSIHNLISTCFKHTAILVPEIESYLEGFMCEVACKKSVVQKSVKNPLGNVHFIK